MRDDSSDPFKTDYHFGFSQNTAIQGDLILGDLGNTGANKTIHLGKVALYNETAKKKRNLFVNKAGNLCIGNEGRDNNAENEIQTIQLDNNGNPLPQSSNSDDRLKHNETEIKNATATLAKIKPYVYDMTNTFLPADYKGPLDEKKTPYRKESGFIAHKAKVQSLEAASASS